MKKGKVLIVDDEAIILRAYAMELKDAAFEVHISDSPADAYRIILEHKPDVVFTDLIMPDMYGVRFCKKVKEIHAGARVVLISGYVDEVADFMGDFIAAGGEEKWLKKPLADGELVAKAEEMMKSVS